MTFETEKLNLEDLENERYPIFDIAILGWNPKYHCDDPFAIDNLTQELQTNKMTAQDSISKDIRITAGQSQKFQKRHTLLSKLE